MRALAFAIAVTACAPRTTPSKSASLDEDLAGGGNAGSTVALSPAAPEVRPIAPPGPGIRSGTIDRARMLAVLDAGVPQLLRQFEVAPRLDGPRFVGWQLVQLLDKQGAFAGIDVVPGDVLLAVNGKPLTRPDQLQAVWDSLRTANEVTAEMWRGKGRFEIRFEIEPKLK